jgi:hypothetical protein
MKQRQQAQFITNIGLFGFYLVTAVNPLQPKSLTATEPLATRVTSGNDRILSGRLVRRYKITPLLWQALQPAYPSPYW